MNTHLWLCMHIYGQKEHEKKEEVDKPKRGRGYWSRDSRETDPKDNVQLQEDIY